MPVFSQHQMVEHEGLVQEVAPGMVKVNLLNAAGCTSCHARSLCRVSETDNKVIEIASGVQGIRAGDRVRVCFEESLGAKALFIGYVIPFFVVMAVLLLAWTITGSEMVSGLSALGSLIPYYLILSLFRNRFRKTFVFTLKSSV